MQDPYSDPSLDPNSDPNDYTLRPTEDPTIKSAGAYWDEARGKAAMDAMPKYDPYSILRGEKQPFGQVIWEGNLPKASPGGPGSSVSERMLQIAPKGGYTDHIQYQKDLNKTAREVAAEKGVNVDNPEGKKILNQTIQEGMANAKNFFNPNDANSKDAWQKSGQDSLVNLITGERRIGPMDKQSTEYQDVSNRQDIHAKHFADVVPAINAAKVDAKDKGISFGMSMSPSSIYPGMDATQPPPPQQPSQAPTPSTGIQPVLEKTISTHFQDQLDANPNLASNKKFMTLYGLEQKQNALISKAASDKETAQVKETTKQDALEKEYRQEKLKALSNRSGGMGLEDGKVNQAIHLESVFQQYEDPKTGEYKVPGVLYNELALGLARLLSPNGQVGVELMGELRQKSAQGDIAGIYTRLTGKPITGTSQEILKMMRDSIERQGNVSEANRDQYFKYMRDIAPTRLDKKRLESLDKGTLNSFSKFKSSGEISDLQSVNTERAQSGLPPLKNKSDVPRGTNQGAPSISSQAEYEKLPSGTTYTWNGNTHVKK